MQYEARFSRSSCRTHCKLLQVQGCKEQLKEEFVEHIKTIKRMLI